VGHVACMGNEKCMQSFGWKVGRERTIRKTCVQMEDNIKMHLRDIGWDVD
jgi:hypothetical protein